MTKDNKLGLLILVVMQCEVSMLILCYSDDYPQYFPLTMCNTFYHLHSAVYVGSVII